MIAADALQSVDLLTLIVSGLFACFSLIGGVYAVPWTLCSQNESAAKEYNKLWTVRLCLQLTATAWLACPYMQLYESWSSYFPALSSSTSQETLCRLYVVLRVGLLEPFFLLLSLLTFKQFLSATESCLPSLNFFSRDGSERRLKKQPKNACIIATSAAWAMLICLVQTVVPSLTEKDITKAEDQLRLPQSSLATYRESSVCWRDDSPTGCITCVLPLASTLISTVVFGCYLYYSWKITLRMGQLAINQAIERRMRLFRSSVSVLLFSSLMFRGLMVVWNPGHVMHEFCKMMDFVSMLLFIMALSFILVVRPIREARIADKSAKSVMTNIFADHRYA